jgi:hypothetical protein
VGILDGRLLALAPVPVPPASGETTGLSARKKGSKGTEANKNDVAAETLYQHQQHEVEVASGGLDRRAD